MATILATPRPARAGEGAGSDEAEEREGDALGLRQRRCAAQFETAQRADMESFRDYDAETFRDGHHPDAVSIFAAGQAFYGIDNIMAVLRSHFEGREAIWSWTEITRQVHGCKTAFVLYETTYAIPRIGFSQRALTAVTYTRVRGRWLAILDQGTLLPQ